MSGLKLLQMTGRPPSSSLCIPVHLTLPTGGRGCLQPGECLTADRLLVDHFAHKKFADDYFLLLRVHHRPHGGRAHIYIRFCQRHTAETSDVPRVIAGLTISLARHLGRWLDSGSRLAMRIGKLCAWAFDSMDEWDRRRNVRQEELAENRTMPFGAFFFFCHRVELTTDWKMCERLRGK